MTFVHDLSTVKDIMTTDLRIWHYEETKKDLVIEEISRLDFDTVPIYKNGKITSLLQVDTGKEIPLTIELIISQDTSISSALNLLAESDQPAFLVMYAQKIVGIITPSDFNKIQARSYIYSLLATLETILAKRTRTYYSHNFDLIVDKLKPLDKTTAQYRKKLRERTSGKDRSRFNLDLIHSLTLNELIELIQQEQNFSISLSNGVDLQQFMALFKGINSLRKAIMHPTRIVLSDEYGLEELSLTINNIINIINIINTQR